MGGQLGSLGYSLLSILSPEGLACRMLDWLGVQK